MGRKRTSANRLSRVHALHNLLEVGGPVYEGSDCEWLQGWIYDRPLLEVPFPQRILSGSLSMWTAETRREGVNCK